MVSCDGWDWRVPTLPKSVTWALSMPRTMNADGGQVCQFKETGSTAFVACFDVDGSQLVGENGSCGGLTCFFSNPARVDSQCTC